MLKAFVFAAALLVSAPALADVVVKDLNGNIIETLKESVSGSIYRYTPSGVRIGTAEKSSSGGYILYNSKGQQEAIVAASYGAQTGKPTNGGEVVYRKNNGTTVSSVTGGSYVPKNFHADE